MTPAPAPPPVAAPAAPQGLEVGILVARKDGSAISPGDRVVTDTNLAITISLAQSAHVYVGGLNAAREPYLLIPAGAASAELAAGIHRIPAPGSWIFLQPPAGPETLFVIASRRPIEAVDRALAIAVGQLPPPEAPVVVAPPPPPPAARPKVVPKVVTEGRRAPVAERILGLVPRGQLKPRTLGIRPDPSIIAPDREGVVVYLLAFHNVPP